MSRRKPVDPGHVNLGVDMDPNGDTTNQKGPTSMMPPSPRLNINRVAYSVRDFHEEFEVVETQKKTLHHQVSRRFLGAITCTPIDFIKSLFPITTWLTNYKIKEWLLADLLAGITVAIFQAPQSMGYSLIAHVPPVHGLYTAFFPAIMYTLFGTSRHSSIGAFAIVSGVMTGNLAVQLGARVVLDPGTEPIPGSTTESDLSTMTDLTTTPTMASIEQAVNIAPTASEVAIAVSFIMGLMLPIASLLRLGFISIYLSDQFLSGFTTAASLYIFTSQLRYLTGVDLPYRSGYFAIVRTIIDLVGEYKSINVASVIISFITIGILLFSKIYVNSWLAKKGITIPFPIELIVVISATIISGAFDFHGRYGVHIVGPIVAGLPPLQLPRFSILQLVGLRAIPFALVGFTISLSIGKFYGRKHGYTVSPNQELLALGAANLFGSLFSCLPAAASLPRSATQEAAGGKTQLVSIINCVLIFFVITYLSSQLDQLPNCILASIIAVALRSLLAQSRQFHMYWQISKLDGAVWMITFLSVVVLDVDIGLYFSLASSLLILIYKSSRPKTYLLGPINESDVYVPVKKYVAAKSIKGIKVYQFCGPLHFACFAFFKKDMLKKIGVNLSELTALRKCHLSQVRRRSKKEPRLSEANINVDLMYDHQWIKNIKDCRIVIVDCSMLSYIDSNGVTGLKLTAQEFEQVGIRFFLAGCAPHVIKMLSKDHFFQEVGANHVYISVHDAVLVAMGYLNNIDEATKPVDGTTIIIDSNNGEDKRNSTANNGHA